MARKVVRRRKKQEERRTNWYVIGGIIALGVIGLFVLLALALQEPEQMTLEAFCEQNAAACVTMGPADAEVTIVEVSDYGCPHCRDFHAETFPLLEESYIEDGQVRWIMLPYALGSRTIPATNAALCAGEQDRYFEYSELLFAQQDEPVALTREGYMQAAEALGLDMEAFTQCIDEGPFNDAIGQNMGRYFEVIQENIDVAREVNVTGTPTFFINGRRLNVNPFFAAFQQRIETLLSS